ncbi:LLM class flavin-dependent oxidoreductase [Candidatus Poribacteria bacterium]|nr:LLM class flavin-dependent oxidoreductase [Candidatus Poribacteria bacterium]MYJ94933.1 LLM class flavin-dependent oxidoreductase [Pseudomonadota bacterium]
MSAQVNFGLWYDFRNPAPRRLQFEDFYSASLEQIVWGEQLGFDSVWLTEHHFRDDGYTPSPLIVASAVGARTRTMRIGTNLMLLPLYHPVRVAEDAATLSLLSGGRFDLGVGAGYVEAEYQTFGRSLRNRPSLMEESIAIIRRAWSGEPVNFEGKRFQVGNIPVLPAPDQPIRILMGAISPPAIERAARISDGFLSSGGVGQAEFIKALADLDKPPDGGNIFAGCWGIVSEDPEREAEALGPHLLHQMQGYLEMGAFGGGDGAPRFDTPADAVTQGFYQFWTPDQAVEQILSELRAYPQILDMHFWAQFPGEPLESGSRRIELLARQVLPKVRAALTG